MKHRIHGIKDVYSFLFLSSPITSQLTYENVRDFLEVDHILYKQKTRYRIHFPFLVEITRVERIPIKLQPSNGYGTEKYHGLTGKGEVWYDFQVMYIYIMMQRINATDYFFI